MIIGILSGIISYFLVHLLLRLFRPKVFISSKIAESSYDSQNYIYRIQIQNMSIRDIGDITIRISYRSEKKGHYTFSVKDIPLLHAKNKQGKSITAKINPTQISGNRTETVREFFLKNSKGFIEIEMSYSDKSPWCFLWSNIRWTSIQVYPCINSIMENSIFVEDSLEPVSLTDYKNRYNNC